MAKLSKAGAGLLLAAKQRKLIKLRFSPDGRWFIEGGGVCNPATVRNLFDRELLDRYVDGPRVYAVPTDAGRVELAKFEAEAVPPTT